MAYSLSTCYGNLNWDVLCGILWKGCGVSAVLPDGYSLIPSSYYLKIETSGVCVNISPNSAWPNYGYVNGYVFKATGIVGGTSCTFSGTLSGRNNLTSLTNIDSDEVGNHTFTISPPDGYDAIGFVVLKCTQSGSYSSSFVSGSTCSIGTYNIFSSTRYASFIIPIIKIRSYTVTYNANGGTVSPSSASYKHGESVTLPTPTLEHNEFLGWYTALEEGTRVGGGGDSYGVTNDSTIYAHWYSLERIVMFHPNGGVISSGTYFKRVYMGEAYGELPTPTRTYYAFDGWYTELDGGTLVYALTVVTATGDHTIYAHWKRLISATYEVVFNDGTGTNSSVTKTFKCDTTVQLPWIVSELGWSIPVGKSLDQAAAWTTSFVGGTIYADHATVENLAEEGEVFYLYANWGRRTVTVTFDAMGGVVSEDTRTVFYGNQIKRLPTATLDGKDLEGWFTQKTGGDLVDETYRPTSNMTLYAHWTAKVIYDWVLIWFS